MAIVKRRSVPPVVFVSHAIAYKTVFETRIHVEPVAVDVDRAHVVSERPFVHVAAYSWGQYPGLWPVEDSWVVEVVAFIPDEAMIALDEALQLLDADIAAGRVVRGTHNAPVEQDPFGRRETELDAFRKAKIWEMERA